MMARNLYLAFLFTMLVTSLLAFEAESLDPTGEGTVSVAKSGVAFDTSPLSGPWPKCTGGTLQACTDIIAAEAPDVTVLVLHPGEGATREYNIFRVIVHVDENDIVTNVPNRG